MKLVLESILICALTGAALTGCITTTKPDGETVTQVDLQTTIALTQLALSTAEQAWDFWQANHKEATAEQVEAERTRREAQIAALREELTALIGQLAALKK